MADEKASSADLVAVQQRWPKELRDRLRRVVGAKQMTVTTIEAVEAWLEEHGKEVKERRRLKKYGPKVPAGEESRAASAESTEEQSSERADESRAASVLPDTPETVAAKMQQATKVVEAARAVFDDGRAEQRERSDVESRAASAKPHEEQSSERGAESRAASVPPSHGGAGAESRGRVDLTEVREAVATRRCPRDGGLVIVRTETQAGAKVLASVACRSCSWSWKR